MLCAWHGQLAKAPWPQHEPAVVDLPLELWATHEGSQLPSSEQTRLEFDKFVYLIDVPLWAIAGPEMQVYTRDSQCTQYFSELAAIRPPADGGRVAIRASLSPRANDATPEYLLVYAVRDAEDPLARIVARPLLMSRQLASPHASPNPADSVNPGPAAPVASCAAPPEEPRQSQSSASARSRQGITDTKRAIQQTVLGALRLRGVRRDSPDFKNLYHIITRATEFALRRRAAVDVNDIHEKVEALLSIIE